jgi:Icc-related predicted phosphoesterase
MKILAFCDIHEDYGYTEELLKKSKDVDLILCAGDITVFGDNLDQAITFLDSFGKKVLCVHGNHESEHEMKRLCEKTKNVKFIHEGVYFFEKLAVIGYGGGGFSKEDDGFSRIEKKFGEIVVNYGRSILLTHAPPYNTKIDEKDKDYHVGNKTFRRFIEKYQPSVAISGHIHETFRKVDKIGKTVLLNPGPGGAIIHT